MDDGVIRNSTIDSTVFDLALADRSQVVVCGGVGRRFAEIAPRAERFAQWLVGAGVRAGDKVALWLPNGLPWVEAHVATAATGAVSVPISTRLTRREVDYIVKHSESKVLVAADRFLKRNYASEARELVSKRSDDGQSVTLVVVDPIRGELPGGLRSSGLPGSQPDDPAVVQYTSGTTGVPKGCLLSHRAWTNNARLSAEVAGLGGDDVILCPSPFFHLFGSLTGLMGALSVGASFITFPRFDARGCADA